MKDATGELSMTAVAVVAIASIGVVFTTLIWPQIKNNIIVNTKCNQALTCETPAGNAKTARCTVCKDEACNQTETVNCPVK